MHIIESKTEVTEAIITVSRDEALDLAILAGTPNGTVRETTGPLYRKLVDVFQFESDQMHRHERRLDGLSLPSVED